MALVKIKPFAVGGVVLILIGIGTIVRRNIVMPAQRQQTNYGDQEIITETRRIVRVPLPASIFLIVAGCGLLFLSTRDHVAGITERLYGPGQTPQLCPNRSSIFEPPTPHRVAQRACYRSFTD